MWGYKMKVIWRIFLCVALMAYAYFLFKISPSVNNLIYSEKIKPNELVGFLVNISVIIFAVCGAWVALVFPKAMEKLKDNSNQTSEIASNDEIIAFKDISICAALSLLVIVFLVVMYFLLSLGNFSAYTDNIKIICFYIISFLYIFQIYILLLTAKVTMKVFSSYGLSLIKRSTDRNFESQSRKER